MFFLWFLVFIGSQYLHLFLTIHSNKTECLFESCRFSFNFLSFGNPSVIYFAQVHWINPEGEGRAQRWVIVKYPSQIDHSRIGNVRYQDDRVSPIWLRVGNLYMFMAILHKSIYFLIDSPFLTKVSLFSCSIIWRTIIPNIQN